MKRYDNYKNSGVSWIGEIPENWLNVRLKLISSITKGKKPSKDYENSLKGLLPYLSMEYLRNKTDEPIYADPNEKNIVLVDEGDILILWDGSKAGEIVRAKKGVLSSTMAKIEIYDNRFDANYLNYLLQLGEKHIQANTIGMGIPHVNGNVLKDLMMLLPTSKEQTQIAAFLDYKTNLIDATIEKKKRLIELLKEKRQAVINEAVTKGLNANAPMKDSGVEWLGEIPEHWKVKKLKHLAKIKNGKDQKEVLIEEGGYPVLGTGGEFGRATTFLYNKPSVLLGRKGTIDKPFYIEEPFWTVDTLFYTEIYDNTYPKFLFYLSTTIRFEYYQESSAVPSMTQENLNNIQLCYPPFNEQVEIVNLINDFTSKVDLTLNKISNQIEKLQDYRQSLISEAVTGKIDVRDWQA